MRARLLFLGASAAALLVGCPQQGPKVGDVSLGEYDVRATQTTAGCEIGEVLQDGDFDFRVKLSGDQGTDVIYMVVSVPPSYIDGVSVTGNVENGALVFTGNNATSLPACGCTPMVEERFVFEPLVAAADGGGSDGGVVDGGTAPDGGADPDGGAAADGGSEPDAGSEADGGVLGLPPLAEIVGLGGSLHYAVGTADDCLPRVTPTDGGAATGCTLPCEIDYLLAGNLR